MRKIKRHAVWLDAPHFATLLYTYGALWVRFVDLNSVKAEPETIWAGRTRLPTTNSRASRGDPGNWPRSLACRQLPSARWHDAALRVEPARPAVPEQLEPMSWRADRFGFTTGRIV